MDITINVHQLVYHNIDKSTWNFLIMFLCFFLKNTKDIFKDGTAPSIDDETLFRFMIMIMIMNDSLCRIKPLITSQFYY